MLKKSFSKILASGLSAFLSGMCFCANNNVFASPADDPPIHQNIEAKNLGNSSPSRDFFNRFMNQIPAEDRTLDLVVQASNMALLFVNLPLLTQQEQNDFASVYRRLDRDWDRVLVGMLSWTSLVMMIP